MVIGMADFALMSLFMGLTNALPLLYILRVLQMFGYSMASTCASVAVIDVIPQKRVGEGLGYYSLAASAAQAFGPSVALFFYHTEGGFFSVMSGMCFMGAVAVMITLCYLSWPQDFPVLLFYYLFCFFHLNMDSKGLKQQNKSFKMK